MPLTPTQCKFFDGCSVPICPVDAHWRKRVMLKGESVCSYLREASKEGAERRFRGDPAEGMYHAANDALHELRESVYPLKIALEKASKAPSKLEQFELNVKKCRGY